MTALAPDSDQDTIVAPATPPGRGAIAIVRISGGATLEILRKIFRPERAGAGTPTHQIRHGRLIHPDTRECVDDVMGVFYQGPHSYTGQDMAELFLHGSPTLSGEAVRAAIQAGARLARPGEFTLRAFLAGKMDLAQAEAVHDLVAARTAYQSRLAVAQLHGSLSHRLAPIRQDIVALVASMEAAVEFGEDGVPPVPPETIRESLRTVRAAISRLEQEFTFSDVVREGFHLVIAGPPNAGKSSLFNRLVGDERAIVAEEPGTTRDLLREPSNLGGIPFLCVDTAGLRSPVSPVEAQGIERCQSAMSQADILLLVLDASVDWTREERDLILAEPPGHLLLVLNKRDLLAHKRSEETRALRPGTPVVLVSAQTGEGLDDLRDAVRQLVLTGGDRPSEDAVVFNARHQSCIRDAGGQVDACLQAADRELSEEYLLYHLRRGLDHLAEITGETTPELVLERIFASFCIGK